MIDAGASSRLCHLRLATYNIHRCVGRDGRFSPDRIVRVIRELKADIIALQEVETRRDAGVQLLQFLAESTATVPIAGPTMLKEDSEYGNAVLTAWQITRHQHIDISYGEREPRGAIDLTLHDGGRHLRVLATHLGLQPVERRHQVEALLRRVREHQELPTVLMGDINEWFLWGRPLRWLHRHFEPTPAPASFPAHLPLLSLDRIWVRPRRALTGVHAHRSSTARLASDHLPIVAELTLGSS